MKAFASLSAVVNQDLHQAEPPRALNTACSITKRNPKPLLLLRGIEMGNRKFGQEITQNRRALRVINQGLVEVEHTLVLSIKEPCQKNMKFAKRSRQIQCIDRLRGDSVFYTLQLGFFYMDFDIISKSIEEGGEPRKK